MITRRLCMVLTTFALAALAGCDRSQPAADSGTADNHAHHDDGHDHAEGDHAHDDAAATDHAGDHHGAPIELGDAKIGSYSVRAARDGGEIKAGGDAPIDVWLTGDLTKIVAVRVWIGLVDAVGSVKVKAEIETPDQPNHFHTHAEVPNPQPAGSKLWVELEITGEGKSTGSFDLRVG